LPSVHHNAAPLTVDFMTDLYSIVGYMILLHPVYYISQWAKSH